MQKKAKKQKAGWWRLRRLTSMLMIMMMMTRVQRLFFFFFFKGFPCYVDDGLKCIEWCPTFHYLHISRYHFLKPLMKKPTSLFSKQFWRHVRAENILFSSRLSSSFAFYCRRKKKRFRYKTAITLSSIIFDLIESSSKKSGDSRKGKKN